MSPAEPRPPAYHHGDLRRALLDGAAALLAETGRWDFSLREVARRAGVSHAAPYRHFADKEALASAVAVAGYEALRARTTAAAAAAAPDAAAILKAIGLAYIGFGVDNPALYRLMFGQALPGVDRVPPAVTAAMGAARGVLKEVILAGARAGAFAVDPGDAEAVTVAAVAAWSLVHGFTLLSIDRVVDREVGRDAIDGLAGRVAERFIAGMLPSARAGGSPP